MADFKGGRGKRAPYETVMYRIPVPIKPVVEILGHTYRLLVDGVADPTGDNLINRVKQAILYSGAYHPPTTSESPNTDSEDSDFDEDFDPDIDDDSEPTDAEVIKTQVKNLQRLNTEVRMLNRELAESEEARSQLDKELNQLHATNGDLNLEITKLQGNLAELESSGSEVDQLRSQLEISKELQKNSNDLLCECHSDAFKAAAILKAALKFKANAGGAIKREIEKAVRLIDDV